MKNGGKKLKIQTPTPLTPKKLHEQLTNILKIASNQRINWYEV